MEYPRHGSLESRVKYIHVLNITFFLVILGRMKKILSEHDGFWNPARKKSMYAAVILLLVSIFLQVILGHYSASRSLKAGWASDLFLDNLPVFDLTFIIVGGAITLWVGAIMLFIVHPQYLIFSTKAIALFIISRAFFFSLTHLGPYPTNISPNIHDTGYRFYHLITFQGNFFYSGHTGFPFLLALIFWESKGLRYLFIALSIFFGITVLLAHVHYSIDVFSAPFIVYGVFIMATKFFSDDYALFSPQRP